MSYNTYYENLVIYQSVSWWFSFFSLPFCWTVREVVRRRYIFYHARYRKCSPSLRLPLSFGCRSRALNLLYYGLLGGRELLQRTYKNLDQRVRLEVRRINAFLSGACFIFLISDLFDVRALRGVLAMIRAEFSNTLLCWSLVLSGWTTRVWRGFELRNHQPKRHKISPAFFLCLNKIVLHFVILCWFSEPLIQPHANI